MKTIRRLLDRFFPPARPWANAARIADDHRAEVSRLETEGDLAFRRKFLPWV